MRKALLLLVSALVLAGLSAPAFAIQCVPYAREVSGINLKGDAWQWWNAAAGLYDRGRTPKDGAVLVFTRQGSMRYGHVSVVTRVISNRLVLVDHANWAPARTSGRGAVTTAVPVLDVSAKNDWSQVRVWFHPAKDFGNRAYRTDGFVYQPKAEGAKRPAIHQAALHKAEELFPTAKPQVAKVEPGKSQLAKVEPAKVAPSPAEAAPAVDSAKAAPAKVEAVAADIAVQAAEPAPAAAHVGTAGLIKVAKHVFRPRRQSVSGEGGPTLDALMFN